MVSRNDRQTHQLPDGSELEFAIRTSDSTAFRVFTADMTRRVRSAQRALGAGTAPSPTGAVTSTGREGTHRSTTTYDLPGGEVTVSIDAAGTGTHAYLHSLVGGAVEYTRTLHVETGRASLLAILLLGGGTVLVAFGNVFLSVPLFGAGGSVALHLVVYWLSTREFAPLLSQIPEPGDPPH